MSRYEVIKDFVDLQDDKHVYRKGEEYPREGYKAKAARIAELSTKKNKLGKALIKKVKIQEDSHNDKSLDEEFDEEIFETGDIPLDPGFDSEEKSDDK